MPSGSNKRRRTRQSLIRWTEEEFAEISKKSDKAGFAVAAFIRAAAIGNAGPRAQRRPPTDHVLLRQILGQLGKIGSNLNQIAKSLNMGDPPDMPELTAALRAYTETRNAIFRALGKKEGPEP